MKKNKLFLLVALFAAFVLVLAACSGDNGDAPAPGYENGSGADTSDGVVPTPQDPNVGNGGLGAAFQPLQDALDYHGLLMAVENNNPLIDGGVLRFGLGVQNPPTWNQLEPTLSTWATENDVRQFTHEPLLYVGQDFFPATGVNSLATATLDRDSSSVTITKNYASTWADGVPLTLADLVYAYYFLSSPYFNVDGNFIGRHFLVNNNWQNVVGVCTHIRYLFENSDTYDIDILRNHAGCGGVGEIPEEATPTITGLTLSEDEMTLTIEFYQVNPYTLAFDFWSTPMPRHHWEGIPHGERLNHPNARENVLGNGPFTIAGHVIDQSWNFVRNDNFWRGPAQLDGVVFETFPVMTAPDVVREGMFDIINFPQSLFTPENRVIDNVSFLSNPFNTNSTNWLIFNMGEWDFENSQIVPWDEPRLSSTVRTAIALSVDRLTSGNALFNGLGVPSGSVYWALNRMDLINPDVETFTTFDLERAIAMLEDAGYVFPYEGADFRVRPDGSELYVIWLMSTSSVAADQEAFFFLEGWRYDLGIDVRLYGGDLQPWATVAEFYQHVTSREVDMFWRGISFGANPNPQWGFGHNSFSNVGRYTNADWQRIIANFESEEMWDPEFARATINEWEQAFIDARVAFPNATTLALTAVNNRVANFSLENTFGDQSRPGHWNVHLWGVTSNEPYIATN